MDSRRRKVYFDTLLEKQEYKCCYCEEEVLITFNKHKRKATLEHLRRKADGGKNTWDNLAIACLECNSERGSIDWFTYTTYKRGELYL